MHYFKTYYKAKSSKFNFAENGYILTPEIIAQYKNIKCKIVEIIKKLIEYHQFCRYNANSKGKSSSDKTSNDKIIKDKITKDKSTIRFKNANDKILKDKSSMRFKNANDKYSIRVENTNKSDNGKPKNLKCITILTALVELYDEIDFFLSILLDELFTFKEIYELNKKKRLLKILNKTLKLFFIFDIIRHKNDFVFNDFAEFKTRRNSIKNSGKDIDAKIIKITFFSAIAMPMAYLFISHFMSENKGLNSLVVDRRGNIYLDQGKKELLYFLACIFSRKKNEFRYCLLFFGGAYCVFFESGYVYDQIRELDAQKVAYFSGIMNIL